MGGSPTAAVLGAGVPNAPSGGRRTATVVEVARPVPHAVRLRLDGADRGEHLPGQHYVIRLTAEDGYVAQRSYSVASPPADPLVELFVERLDEGEVSTYLADVLEPGDQLDVRGPIGGWFVWEGASPALLGGGGWGVGPLCAGPRAAFPVSPGCGTRGMWAVRTCCGSPSPAAPWSSCPTPTSSWRPVPWSSSPARRTASAPPDGSPPVSCSRCGNRARPLTCADRRPSRRPPAGSWWTWACHRRTSASSGSARAARCRPEPSSHVAGVVPGRRPALRFRHGSLRAGGRTWPRTNSCVATCSRGSRPGGRR